MQSNNLLLRGPHWQTVDKLFSTFLHPGKTPDYCRKTLENLTFDIFRQWIIDNLYRNTKCTHYFLSPFKCYAACWDWGRLKSLQFRLPKELKFGFLAISSRRTMDWHLISMKGYQHNVSSIRETEVLQWYYSIQCPKIYPLPSKNSRFSSFWYENKLVSISDKQVLAYSRFFIRLTTFQRKWNDFCRKIAPFIKKSQWIVTLFLTVNKRYRFDLLSRVNMLHSACLKKKSNKKFWFGKLRYWFLHPYLIELWPHSNLSPSKTRENSWKRAHKYKLRPKLSWS